jgi:hypothetical protein
MGSGLVLVVTDLNQLGRVEVVIIGPAPMHIPLLYAQMPPPTRLRLEEGIGYGGTLLPRT